MPVRTGDCPGCSVPSVAVRRCRILEETMPDLQRVVGEVAGRLLRRVAPEMYKPGIAAVQVRRGWLRG
jgi:hypothetical protein